MRSVLVVVALAVAVAACDSNRKPRPPVVSPPPPVTVIPAPVTQTVGAAGGTIAGPAGITLTIPAGALAADTALTIALDPSVRPDLPNSFTAFADPVVLTPHGTTFGVPVTISFPLDRTRLPAGATPMFLKTIGDSGQLQQLTAEISGDTVRAAITGFSIIHSMWDTNPAPYFLRQPENSHPVEEGTFWAFSVETVSYARPLRYQWSEEVSNSNGIPNETNQGIVVRNIHLNQNGARYLVSVTDGAGRVTRSDPAVLTVVRQPDDVEAVVGDSVQFVGSNAVTAVMSMRWQRSRDGGMNWEDIDAANGASYSLANVELGNNGWLFRFVARSSGVFTSRAALLTVIPAPTQPAITVQPAALSVPAGSSAVFKVEARGGRLSYQWERSADGVTFMPITDGDSARLTLPTSLLGDDNTRVRVRVSNVVGSVTSDAAQLRVRLSSATVLKRVGAGVNYSVGLRGDGRLRSWGNNRFGSLGDGTNELRTNAVDVVDVTRAAALSVGSSHALVVLDTGELWGWGRATFGAALGVTTDQFAPIRIQGFGPGPISARVRSAAASGPNAIAYSLVVLEGSGEVWGLGANEDGQLGDGTTTPRSVAARVGDLTGVVSVSAGDGHALALRSDGSVYAWGKNDFGQLGNDSRQASLRPISIRMSEPIVAVFAGDRVSYALDINGDVWGWGWNTPPGVLGDAEVRADRLIPVRIPLPAPAVDLALGNAHRLALLADGRVFAWGTNTSGECGCGDVPNIIFLPRQVIAPPLPSTIRSIGAGHFHSLAMDEDGNVWTWGRNHFGQISGGVDADPDAHEPLSIPVPNVNLLPLDPVNQGVTLSVAFRNPRGASRATSSPAGIDCTPTSGVEDCRETYAPGTVVTLTAFGAQSVVWENCDRSVATNTCEVTMNADRTVIAPYFGE